MDVNRQAWTARSNLLVHPASLYVGLRSERIFVEREEPLRIEAIVTDLDGKPVAGTRDHHASGPARLALQERRVGRGGSRPAGLHRGIGAASRCAAPSRPRRAAPTASPPTITDDEGRRNRSRVHPLGQRRRAAARAPGRAGSRSRSSPTARNISPATRRRSWCRRRSSRPKALLTLRRSGILSTERFTLSGPTTVLQIPIEDAYIPNLYVQVDLVGFRPARRSRWPGRPGTAVPTGLRHRSAQPDASRRSARTLSVSADAARSQGGARR